jgi:hypothetical protein
MNPFEKYKKPNRDHWVRTVGLSLAQFQHWVEPIRIHLQVQQDHNPLRKRGLKSKLSLENQVLLAWLYWRDYPTFIKLGLPFGISESYAHQIYHNMSTLLVKILQVNNRQTLFEENLNTGVVEVTEQPIERPQNGQTAYCSGKKNRHTLKVQLIIGLATLAILKIYCEQGQVHDFKMLKDSKVLIHPTTTLRADSGYQGIGKIHSNSQIPVKRKKKPELAAVDQKYHRQLASVRGPIEPVNRRGKIFRVVKEVYRGQPKHYSKTWNLIAGWVNWRYHTV